MHYVQEIPMLFIRMWLQGSCPGSYSGTAVRSAYQQQEPNRPGTKPTAVKYTEKAATYMKCWLHS